MAEFHPVAEIFPLMGDDEIRELAEDIAANGQQEAITLHADGRIIDGRNRYLACERLGIEPSYRTWSGNGSLVAFVVSLNLRRRHLSSSQRAMVAADALPLFEKEAKERQRQGSQKIADPNLTGKATEKAADALNTNRQYVSDAKAIIEKAPEKAEAVRRGEKTISQVKREMQKEKARGHTAPLPSDKYRVVYADPPWSYGNTMAADSENELFMKRWTAAETHYPAMTIVELCALDIASLVDDNAVLFLWVTSPLLAECWPVIRAWGFQYKSSFVWDKVGHNFGHYNSVRHEFLLICTRGSCTPDTKELVDSVQTIEKSRRHSEKPERFREIIDQLYPSGKRIELFARTETEGWDAWGNQMQNTTANITETSCKKA